MGSSKNYKWIALSCTTIGAFVSILSGSTVLISLPTIMKDLNTSMSLVIWILMGYMLSMTILVPAFGRIADMYGRKKLYVAGFAIFTVASLLCALSQNGVQLLIFRIVQSVGGAFMVANSTAIVADAFPPRELGKALGINSMVISISAVLGPIVGGLLTTVGWRSIFYINIPIGIIGTVWAALQLKESVVPGKRQKFDLKGTLTFSLALLSLLLALTLGGFSSWSQPIVMILLVACVVLFALFVWCEKRAPYPMLNLTLLKKPILTFSYISCLLNGVARGAVTFLLVFFLQGIKGYDPILAGIMLAPLALPMVVVAPISGHLSDKYGSRVLSSVGLFISALGLLGMMFISENTSVLLLSLFMVVMGIGSGMFFSPNTSSIMGNVPVDQRGVAAGLRTMANNAGNVLSIAISMAIIASSISPDAMQALFVGTQVGAEGIQVEAFINGLRVAFTISFVFSLIAAAMSYMKGSTKTSTNETTEMVLDIEEAT